MNEFIYFFTKGFHHILSWRSYDHILFLTLITVAYTFTNWKKTGYLLTLFTLGHALTLLLVTYDLVSIDKNWIGILIPISTLIMAFFNVYTAGKELEESTIDFNLIFVFFFGLIHGLSFGNGFKQIIRNYNKDISFLEFSLGVEASQIVVAFIILLIGLIFQTVIKFTKRDYTLVISAIIIGLVIPILIANKFW